jgi:Bacterial extracellular solute-binding proteins, family 5 Middle
MVVAGIKGDLAAGVELIYDPLMVLSLDEVASAYGLIAEAARYPADFSWVSFRLRPDARWHDSRPILVEDVLFSLKAFRNLHPQLSIYYRHVKRAAKTGDHEVTFQFDTAGIRELPQVMAQLVVLPQHWWEGRDGSGKPRRISDTSLEPPLGSGTRLLAISVRLFDVIQSTSSSHFGKKLASTEHAVGAGSGIFPRVLPFGTVHVQRLKPIDVGIVEQPKSELRIGH